MIAPVAIRATLVRIGLGEKERERDGLQLASGDFLHHIARHRVEHVEERLVGEARDLSVEFVHIVHGVALRESEFGLHWS